MRVLKGDRAELMSGRCHVRVLSEQILILWLKMMKKIIIIFIDIIDIY